MTREPARRCAIVTGGGQGIGRAVAARLLHDDMAVVVVDLDAEACADAVDEFDVPDRTLATTADVSSEEDVRRFVGAAMDRFGRIDLLVNNAGISRNRPIGELTLDDWQAVIGTNLTGQFLCAKHAAPHLAAAEGAIVNIASTRALMSEPDTEAYSASKGGIVALTHALAVSLGPNVRVNCISPGWIDVSGWKKRSVRAKSDLTARDHAQHPAGRVGRPEDIAECVAWLASDSASFMTGAQIVLDGGMTRKMIYEE